MLTHRVRLLVVVVVLIAGSFGGAGRALSAARASGAHLGWMTADPGPTSSNIPPTVHITCPQPSPLVVTNTLPSLRILWEGSDPDGFTGKPVKYKYLLLGPASEFPIALAISNPDSLRRYYANHPLGPWAGWDSTSADTTQARYVNLIPNVRYLFVVIAFDELGAYSPVFSLSSNMVALRVTFQGFLGPRLTLIGPNLHYQYPTGGYCACPAAEVPTDMAANRHVKFEWFADPDGVCQGADIRSYRWALDIADVTDQTPRTDEATDLQHWSAPSLTTTSATIGPFVSGQQHRLYVEAADNAGQKSLGIILITVVPGHNESPSCAGTRAEPRVLWPPDHQFVPVDVTGVVDPDGDPIAITVTRVTQDESPDDCSDAFIDANGKVLLRAERAGHGNGRVYTIWFTASDGQGGSCDGSVQVCVPHDRNHLVCAADGQVFDSMHQCLEDPQPRVKRALPATVMLSPIARNGNTATLRYALPAPAQVMVAVYDVAGRRIATLENTARGAGPHEITWNTSSLPHGMYFCRFQTGAVTMTKTVLITR